MKLLFFASKNEKGLKGILNIFALQNCFGLRHAEPSLAARKSSFVIRFLKRPEKSFFLSCSIANDDLTDLTRNEQVIFRT